MQSPCSSAEAEVRTKNAFLDCFSSSPESGKVDFEVCEDWSVAWRRNEQRTAMVPSDYDLRLKHVTVKMRAVLLDWLFEVILH